MYWHAHGTNLFGAACYGSRHFAATDMDLKSTHPFWFIKNGLIRSYPAITNDVICDVAVIGAGITGALVADQLSRVGFSVIVLDRREVGLGSTSASTSLLQYEIDVSLVELSELIGKPRAQRAYQLSYSVIDELAERISTLPSNCTFQRKQSLYVASSEDDAKLLEREYAAQRELGFEIELLTAAHLRERYRVSAPAALVSPHAASVDAYQLAHALLHRTCENGGRVFDRTRVLQFEPSARGTRLTTDRGPSLDARHVVIATGYESQAMLSEPIVQLKSTYAIVTQPLESLYPWNSDWIMWETKRPYLYLRSTPDQRLLAGGEDDNFKDPIRRDQSIRRKSEILLERLQELFPKLELEIEFGWAGTFGETKDGLPYIGQSPEYPNCWFALGFGGNGITFSAIAAQLIADALQGNPSSDLELFRFGR